MALLSLQVGYAIILYIAAFENSHVMWFQLSVIVTCLGFCGAKSTRFEEGWFLLRGTCSNCSLLTNDLRKQFYTVYSLHISDQDSHHTWYSYEGFDLTRLFIVMIRIFWSKFCFVLFFQYYGVSHSVAYSMSSFHITYTGWGWTLAAYRAQCTPLLLRMLYK